MIVVFLVAFGMLFGFMTAGLYGVLAEEISFLGLILVYAAASAVAALTCVAALYKRHLDDRRAADRRPEAFTEATPAAL